VTIDAARIAQVLADLELLSDRRRFHAIDFYQPYPPQMEFHRYGATKRERLLRAGNQEGKTFCGSAEMSYHLSGKYPAWWEGRRFKKPIKAWVAGEGAVLVRDGPQTLLCGEPGVDDAFGTGLIPKDLFADKPSLSRGVTDAYDTIQVYHETNGVRDGISTCSFKSYDQGRKKFQTKTLDFGWCDEEPPEDIYNEMLARIQATGGMLMLTFTPLSGYSAVVNKFLRENSPDRSDTVMTLYDAKHIPVEERARIIASFPIHQRQARTMGEPMIGSGAIFPVDPESITENDIPYVPDHWTKIWGIDFGIGHPFAAVLIAWDKDTDTLHVLHSIRMVDAGPLQHAAAMKPIAGNVKVAWPQDGTQRRDDGKPLADHYKRQGLRMLEGHAKWPDGSISTEAGIFEMHERMTTNRFKVARSLMLGPWGEEFRMYHRNEDGVDIVKVKDDLMSATRIAVMAKRFGLVGPFGPTTTFGTAKRGETRPQADNVDFPLFG
jgi:phage terminase large subunit-like protein